MVFINQVDMVNKFNLERSGKLFRDSITPTVSFYACRIDQQAESKYSLMILAALSALSTALGTVSLRVFIIEA